ncbi:MAG TPA: hypothetical protein PLZ44_09730 [Methanothrix sp.]|nr:hypothetical protein [Methanothrix sp.]
MDPTNYSQHHCHCLARLRLPAVSRPRLKPSRRGSDSQGCCERGAPDGGGGSPHGQEKSGRLPATWWW